MKRLFNGVAVNEIEDGLAKFVAQTVNFSCNKQEIKRSVMIRQDATSNEVTITSKQKLAIPVTTEPITPRTDGQRTVSLTELTSRGQGGRDEGVGGKQFQISKFGKISISEINELNHDGTTIAFLNNKNRNLRKKTFAEQTIVES